MKLIIDRSKWYRGQLEGSALVRTYDGKMCCLGFLGIAFGGDPSIKVELVYPVVGEESGILGQTMPNKGQTFWPKWLFSNFDNSNKENISQYLAYINDNPRIDDVSKELEISAIMKKYGDIDVEFIDRESPPIPA